MPAARPVGHLARGRRGDRGHSFGTRARVKGFGMAGRSESCLLPSAPLCALSGRLFRAVQSLGLDEERDRRHLAGLQVLDLDPRDAEERDVRVIRA
jgi:hypothetical protein